VAKRRPYHSPTRQRQAEQTRERILDAAQALLLDDGYFDTTVEAIARRADVAVQTVTAAFANKRGLLRAVLERASFGQPYRRLVTQARQTTDARGQLDVAARITRNVYEAGSAEFELLHTAAVVDPDVAALRTAMEQRRRERQAGLVDALWDRGELQGGLSASKALDLVTSITSYELYRLLVVQHGWSPSRYQACIAHMLESALLRGNGLQSTGR
jgi:AcrR family transcriptional regulator